MWRRPDRNRCRQLPLVALCGLHRQTGETHLGQIVLEDGDPNLRPEFGGCFVFCLVRGGLVVACFHYMGGVGGWWWG